MLHASKKINEFPLSISKITEIIKLNHAQQVHKLKEYVTVMYSACVSYSS